MTDDLETWKEIVRSSKTSWIMLHLYSSNPQVIEWTLEDYKLVILKTLARDVLFDELDARIPPREGLVERDPS